MQIKIAYFNGALKKGDGVTHVLLDLIREAIKKGNEPLMITSRTDDGSIMPVPVIQTPAIVFPLYREYYLALPGIRGFKKKLDEFKPDIIHIHSPDTNGWAALKYAKKNHIPIVATHHTDFNKYLSYYHLSIFRPLLSHMLKRLYTQMNFVTTPSESVSQELIEHGVKDVFTIPWGVDPTRFNPSFRSMEWREKILKKKEGKILLCVCRLTWEKDLRTLAEIYNLLRRDRNDFSMIIVGDGPIRRELESLMPGAIFLGFIEGLELSKVYASCDIFIFPSSTETFGSVTIEAMASGLVPIVALAGGSKSLVQNGENGFLARPKDVSDFYEKTRVLLDDNQKKEKMRSAGLISVKKFAWEKVFGEFLSKYLTLLDV